MVSRTQLMTLCSQSEREALWCTCCAAAQSVFTGLWHIWIWWWPLSQRNCSRANESGIARYPNILQAQNQSSPSCSVEISTSAPTDPKDLVTALAKGSKSPIKYGSAACASSRDTGSTSIAFCASIDLGDSSRSLVVWLFRNSPCSYSCSTFAPQWQSPKWPIHRVQVWWPVPAPNRDSSWCRISLEIRIEWHDYPRWPFL